MPERFRAATVLPRNADAPHPPHRIPPVPKPRSEPRPSGSGPPPSNERGQKLSQTEDLHIAPTCGLAAFSFLRVKTAFDRRSGTAHSSPSTRRRTTSQPSYTRSQSFRSRQPEGTSHILPQYRSITRSHLESAPPRTRQSADLDASRPQPIRIKATWRNKSSF